MVAKRRGMTLSMSEVEPAPVPRLVGVLGGAFSAAMLLGFGVIESAWGRGLVRMLLLNVQVRQGERLQTR